MDVIGRQAHKQVWDWGKEHRPNCEEHRVGRSVITSATDMLSETAAGYEEPGVAEMSNRLLVVV